MRPGSPPAEVPIFRSGEQARLLAALYLAPDRTFTFQDLDAGLTSRATGDRELRRLLDAGMVEVRRVGRTRTFGAATRSPLFTPLRQLIERTLGVEPQLRQRLARVPGVTAAAIFGSWAAQRIDPESDIDVIVIGEADYEELVVAARPVSELARRELNLVAFGIEEARRRLDDASGFLRRVLSGPLVPLVGDPRFVINSNAER